MTVWTNHYCAYGGSLEILYILERFTMVFIRSKGVWMWICEATQKLITFRWKWSTWLNSSGTCGLLVQTTVKVVWSFLFILPRVQMGLNNLSGYLLKQTLCHCLVTTISCGLVLQSLNRTLFMLYNGPGCSSFNIKWEKKKIQRMIFCVWVTFKWDKPCVPRPDKEYASIGNRWMDSFCLHLCIYSMLDFYSRYNTI